MELGGGDHCVDMLAHMLCTQRRPRSVEDPLVRLWQVFRGQDREVEAQKKHMGDIALAPRARELWEEEYGPS